MELIKPVYLCVQMPRIIGENSKWIVIGFWDFSYSFIIGFWTDVYTS